MFFRILMTITIPGQILTHKSCQAIGLTTRYFNFNRPTLFIQPTVLKIRLVFLFIQNDNSGLSASKNNLTIYQLINTFAAFYETCQQNISIISRT